MTWMTENLHRHISPKFKSQQFTHHLILSFPYVPSISIILPKYYPLLLFQRNTTGCHCHSHGNKCSKWKKKVWIHGSGNSHLTKHETQDKWRETDTVEVRSTDENRGGENEDEEEEERKKAFYFLFCQNEFQGSSAPGDVVVRCQKASYKYRLSCERTTSQHRPLCGHKQRKWMVMQTKEEKTREEEKQLKGGCKLVSVRRSSLVKKPTQTWRKWNEG